MSGVPQLPELIKTAQQHAASDDPLAQLAAASELRFALEEVSDALLDHFVEAARDAGCSWSQIGNALGVSKQAAQQRHANEQSVARRLLARVGIGGGKPSGGLFGGRFGPAARETVIAAQGEARSLGHRSIGSEHLLLGLLKTDNTACEALRTLGVGYESARNDVVDLVGVGEEAPSRHIPFTPRAKKILELSLRESLKLKSRVIGAEHLLLAIVREDEGRGMQVLVRSGADAASVRRAIDERGGGA